MLGHLEVLGKWKIGCPGEHVDLAPLERGRGEAAHDRSRLQMKVPKHSPNLPPTKEEDKTSVDTSAEKCHGAGGTEAASTDIIRPDHKFCTMYAGCRFEGLGDVATFDVA